MGKIRGVKLLGYFGIKREKAIWAGLSKKIPYEVFCGEIGSLLPAASGSKVHYGKTDVRKR